MSSPTSDGNVQNSASLPLRLATITDDAISSNDATRSSNPTQSSTTFNDCPVDVSVTPNFTILTHKSTTNNKCANCAGRAAQQCPRCVNGVDRYGNPSKTFYCGKECQRIHWHSFHQVDCKVFRERRQLYRIGSLLQCAFYETMKLAWYDEIEKVKRVGQDGEDRSAKLVIWRMVKTDNTSFSTFPEALFGKERDRQAVLAQAAPAVTIMSRVLEQLLAATKSEIKIHEVALCPKAMYYVRSFEHRSESIDGPQTSSLFHIAHSDGSLSDQPVSWVFCATLQDDSKFAIDVCNAQYSMTASQEHQCGVFPWEEYLQRLDIHKGTQIDYKPLIHCLDVNRYLKPTGTIKDVDAGIFALEDIRRSVIGAAVISSKVCCAVLQERTKWKLAILLRASSADFDRGFAVYKHCFQLC